MPVDDANTLFRKMMNEGHSAAWDQDWSAAAESYKRALKYKPDHPSALANLALAYYQLRMYEQALGTYTRLAKVSKDDPIPFEKMAELNERLGNLKLAVTYFLQAADLHLKLRNVEKAIENWVHVIQVDPEHLQAHSRLALAYERLGRKDQAVTEYLALASLYQRLGEKAKAQSLLQRAASINPRSSELQKAARLFAAGQLLPKPARPKGGTGPIRIAKVKRLDAPKDEPVEHLDPVSMARKQALTLLADILFEISDDNDDEQLTAKPSLQALMRSTGPLQNLASNRSRIILHLSQVIDSQLNGNASQAASELSAAVDDGFEHAAAYFDLGLLYFETGQLDKALSSLQHVVGDPHFRLATHLLMAQIYEQQTRWKEAALDYMQALKLADAEMVSAQRAADLRQLYEPILETLADKNDEAFYQKVCQNIKEMLMRPDWRIKLKQARESFDESHPDALLPLAELIMSSQSGQIVESLDSINRLARGGLFRTAMEEAYFAISFAPGYLPLHALVGDLLVKSNRLDDAVQKYKVVAHSYSVRGEKEQTIQVLRKVVGIAPMDLKARRMLIDELVSQEFYAEAIGEYVNLADFYYRLAQLQQAREAYTHALRLAQKHSRDPQVSANILERMADIDLQRLDWKQALRVYEQICTLTPDNLMARKQVVDLSLRLGQRQKASSALKDLIAYLEKDKPGAALQFLEDFLREQPDHEVVQQALADLYARAGRVNEAIDILERLADRKLNEGAQDEAVTLINRIIDLNPPNVDDYRRLLSSL